MGRLFKTKNVFGGVLLSFTLFLIGCNSGGSENYRPYNSNSSNSYNSTSASTDSVEPVKKDTLKWRVEETVDEMTDTKNVLKTLHSENEVEFASPYSGGAFLDICVKYVQRTGTEVFVKLSKGQLFASEYKGTDFVTVRFDDDAAQKFHVTEPADGSNDILFIDNARGFINRAKTAKSIKMEVPVYREGTPLFTFKVDEPLTWEY